MIFHFRPFPAKTKDKVFWNMEKTSFLAHFGLFLPIFRAMRIFLENPASRTTSRGFLSPCQKLEKTNDQIPTKLLDRRTDIQTHRPYFIGIFRPRPEPLIHYLRIELIKRYNFYFQILIKRKIPGQKKYFPGFQKIVLDFPGFPGHAMKFQVFQVCWQPWWCVMRFS